MKPVLPLYLCGIRWKGEKNTQLMTGFKTLTVCCNHKMTFMMFCIESPRGVTVNMCTICATSGQSISVGWCVRVQIFSFLTKQIVIFRLMSNLDLNFFPQSDPQSLYYISLCEWSPTKQIMTKSHTNVHVNPTRTLRLCVP